MGLVVHRESLAYSEEYGWDLSFEALVASIVSDFLTNFKPDRERCWLAEAAGNHVGHVFLVQHPERADTAKLRLLFVERAARGMGARRMLVDECLAFAHATGYCTVTLWTQRTALHRRASYSPLIGSIRALDSSWLPNCRIEALEKT